MPYDIMDIGSTPHSVDGAQVGSDNYRDEARKECNALIHQMRRICGPEPDGAYLYISANPHDFGTYYSVAVKYDDRNNEAARYAYRCEAELPEYWDAEAMKELGLTPDIGTTTWWQTHENLHATMLAIKANREFSM